MTRSVACRQCARPGAACAVRCPRGLCPGAGIDHGRGEGHLRRGVAGRDGRGVEPGPHREGADGGVGRQRPVPLREPGPGRLHGHASRLPGFSTVKRDGITIAGDFTATINVELRVGAQEETITVTGEAPIVDVQGVHPADGVDQRDRGSGADGQVFREPRGADSGREHVVQRGVPGGQLAGHGRRPRRLERDARRARQPVPRSAHVDQRHDGRGAQPGIWA